MSAIDEAINAHFRSRPGRAHIRAWSTRHRLNGEAGSVSLELVLMTPVVLALVVLVVVCGRITRAEAIVRSAAAAGARAASIRQEPGAARADAVAAVRANLDGVATTCSDPSVSVDVGDLRPGGQVSVQVTCEARLSDLVLVGLPGARRLSARSIEVVDRWRGG